MSNQYSIVRYIPNPIAGEQINIGVLVFNEESTRVRFLKNWERVRSFGMEDMGFLEDFVCRMEKAVMAGLLFPGDREDGTAKKQRLQKIARGWINSIQFSEPRSSLANLENLLEETVKDYLIEPLGKYKDRFSESQSIDDLKSAKTSKTVTTQNRDRKAVARLAIAKIRETLKQQIGDREARELLKRDYKIIGNKEQHRFDAVVANGQPYFVAHGISFEVQVRKNLQDALAWMIRDVKDCHQDLPVAIVVLPPKEENENYPKLEEHYRKAVELYSELGAKILAENRIQPWVSHNLKSLPI